MTDREELDNRVRYKLYKAYQAGRNKEAYDDCEEGDEIIALVTAHNRQLLMDKILNLPATKHDRRVFYQLTEEELHE